MVDAPEIIPGPSDRLMSLDFFRGVAMFFLIAEVTGLYGILDAQSLRGTIVQVINIQFQHRQWNGLYLWDLGQPFFMFICGVSMAFSYGKRWEKGAKWGATFRHVLQRSFLLFLFGWAIYFIEPGEAGRSGAFLYDTLPQISLACLIAFLMMRKSPLVQIIFTFGLLILTELLYRLLGVPGFDQPFVPGHNFGSYIDMLLIGKLSDGHWVAFNAVPMASLTIWGVMAGQLLRTQRQSPNKIRILLAAGLIGITTGYSLSSIIPIIRRIATNSFVIVSGGYCFLALAISFWIIDMLKFRRGTKFFAIIGMNPLFIYLFTQTGGEEWFRNIAQPFCLGLFGWAGERQAQLVVSLAVILLLWYLCYWLYKKKIFIRV